MRSPTLWFVLLAVAGFNDCARVLVLYAAKLGDGAPQLHFDLYRAPVLVVTLKWSPLLPYRGLRTAN